VDVVVTVCFITVNVVKEKLFAEIKNRSLSFGSTKEVAITKPTAEINKKTISMRIIKI
jgi:hypothetical protein